MEILNDFKTSVSKALSEISRNWDKYDGLIVCGTHAPKDVEEQLNTIKFYREKGLPILGICMGLQLIVIEYYRNVLMQKTANSEEIDPTAFPVVSKLPTLRVGIHPVANRMESHWHNYAVSKLIGDRLPGEKIYTGDILEEWKSSTMIATQYHPEYESSKNKPHPILKEFIRLCKTN